MLEGSAAADLSIADCAEMLGGIPPVPETLEEFAEFLKTGRFPLPPSKYARFIMDWPSLQHFVFPAASADSGLAKDMERTIRSYLSVEDRSEEICGQNMTSFTGYVWEAMLGPVAPPHFSYNLSFDRNKDLPHEAATGGYAQPDLVVFCGDLLLFIGEETIQQAGRSTAVQDIQCKTKNGYSPLFYQDIPYMPVYAAAGDEIQFGFVTQDGKLKMIDRALNLTRKQDRVECLAASVALYRLFAALLALAPDMTQRVPYFRPLKCPHQTFITYALTANRGPGSAVRKEIFEPGHFFATYGLDVTDLKRAYELANTSEYIIHCTPRLPDLTKRTHPVRMTEEDAYYVQLTTLGCPKPIDMWSPQEMKAAVRATIEAAKLLHSEGLVHADLRPANILWNSEGPFVTDLEQVHKAGYRVEHEHFNGWTDSTLDANHCYTELSEMHQIGVLMRAWAAEPGKTLVGDGADLMEKLLSKKLAANDAALHPWLAAEAQ